MRRWGLWHAARSMVHLVHTHRQAGSCPLHILQSTVSALVRSRNQGQSGTTFVSPLGHHNAAKVSIERTATS